MKDAARTMTPSPHRQPRIKVSNFLLEGIPSEATIPTFLVCLDGLSRDEAREEIEHLGHLQEISPTFRIVILTDGNLFDLVRPYGWPVEHFPSTELAHQLSSPDELRSFRLDRIRVVKSHFVDVRVVERSHSASAASRVARLLDCVDLADAPAARKAKSSTRPLAQPFSLDPLGPGETAEVELSGGRAEVSVVTRGSGPLLIVAGCGMLPQVGTALPRDALHIHIDFAPDSTFAFEAHTYAEIVRNQRRDLSVVLPWRQTALGLPSAAQSIDVALKIERAKLLSISGFRPGYTELAGSDSFDWEVARDYACIRRIAAAFSRI